VSNISELCQWLVSTRKSNLYQLICRVFVLILTLHVSTITNEKAFSAMSIIKTKFRNKIEDEFVIDSLILYIKREIAAKFSIDSIRDDFLDLREHQVPF
jgi:hypothetical protein